MFKSSLFFIRESTETSDVDLGRGFVTVLVGGSVDLGLGLGWVRSVSRRPV